MLDLMEKFEVFVPILKRKVECASFEWGNRNSALKKQLQRMANICNEREALFQSKLQNTVHLISQVDRSKLAADKHIEVVQTQIRQQEIELKVKKSELLGIRNQQKDFTRIIDRLKLQEHSLRRDLTRAEAGISELDQHKFDEPVEQTKSRQTNKKARIEPQAAASTHLTSRSGGDVASICSAGAQALYEDGRNCFSGSGFQSVDKNQGRLMIELAAANGCKCAIADCLLSGWGGRKADEITAFGIFTEEAVKGRPCAQSLLGQCYLFGTGVEENKEEGLKWIRKAAGQSYSEGQLFLGLCYDNGEGVEADKLEAVKWYRKSAEQGNAAGQQCLGSSFYLGEGVDTNKVEAVKWYKRAAEQGHAAGQQCLGLCYSNGEGVDMDKQEAVKWYERAAEQGYAAGQQCLGLCYSNGDGVDINELQAVKWYRMAAEQGDQEAQDRLGDFIQKQTIDSSRLIEASSSSGAEVGE